MKTFKLIPVIILSVLFVSCQKEIVTSSNSTLTATTYLNTSYGSDPLQNMDIYLPAGRTTASTKVIVMIHGGAWASGDKSELTQFVDTLKRRVPDYAIFNINYRLSAAPANVFPTQENDVKAAIEFIFNKAVQYAISDKYVFIGASAGGHLALLQGYKYSSPVKPKAIVSFSGPTDLNDMYNNPAGGNPLISFLLASAVGKIPSQDPLLYTNSSPVNFITTGAPATLLLYGDLDQLVRYTQANLAITKLTAAGAIYQSVLFNGSAHVDTWSNDVFFESFTRIQAFLTAHVR